MNISINRTDLKKLKITDILNRDGKSVNVQETGKATLKQLHQIVFWLKNFSIVNGIVTHKFLKKYKQKRENYQ